MDAERPGSPFLVILSQPSGHVHSKPSRIVKWFKPFFSLGTGLCSFTQMSLAVQLGGRGHGRGARCYEPLGCTDQRAGATLMAFASQSLLRVLLFAGQDTAHPGACCELTGLVGCDSRAVVLFCSLTRRVETSCWVLLGQALCW